MTIHVWKSYRRMLLKYLYTFMERHAIFLPMKKATEMFSSARNKPYKNMII